MSISPLLQQPGVTIGDLVDQEVIPKCENRVQDVTRAYRWVRDAIIELTTHTDYRDDFDELEIWGEPFVLTPGLSEYQFSDLMPLTTDPILGTPGTTLNAATLSVLMWTDPPTNSRYIRLNSDHYSQSDKSSSVRSGQPSGWYRFADTINFNIPPNKAYQIRARILRMHPMNDEALQLTSILINRDWHEIIAWAAVERGFMELLEFDKAAAVHQLLHGDPKYPAKPGLFNGAKKRRKREAWRQNGSLRPIIRPYSYGR